MKNVIGSLIQKDDSYFSIEITIELKFLKILCILYSHKQTGNRN